ncbi:hypothetical protein Baya_16611 [Bagarius yarrelli]|uniref:Uncharacterized protein n=1 Tax=Bagarius yarrelli TaxID=175774 RepID=A0A556VW46_BAGYA|nr:hypothetical protein Baya_16611 [Bagarius yarrelli]
MPQVSPKCRRLSRVFTSAPPAGDGIQERIGSFRNRLKRRKETNKPNSVSFPTGETTGCPLEEDWEQEIEEEKEKEQSNAEEALKLALCEMNLYSVPCAPRPHPQHYNPSQHHTPPVRWIQHVSSIETDQFADAEE